MAELAHEREGKQASEPRARGGEASAGPLRSEGGDSALLSKRKVSSARRYNRRRYGTNRRDQRRWRTSPSEIQAMQSRLGAPSTGELDEDTAQAVSALQEAKGLRVDGKIGPKTEPVAGLTRQPPGQGQAKTSKPGGGAAQGEAGGEPPTSDGALEREEEKTGAAPEPDAAKAPEPSPGGEPGRDRGRSGGATRGSAPSPAKSPPPSVDPAKAPAPTRDDRAPQAEPPARRQQKSDERETGEGGKEKEPAPNPNPGKPVRLVITAGAKKVGYQKVLAFLPPGGLSSATPDVFLFFHGHHANYGIDDKEKKKGGRDAGSKQAAQALASSGRQVVALFPQGFNGGSNKGKGRHKEGGYMKSLRAGLPAFLGSVFKQISAQTKLAGLAPGNISIAGHSAGGYMGVKDALSGAGDFADKITEVTLMDTSYSTSHFKQVSKWMVEGRPGKAVRIIGSPKQVSARKRRKLGKGSPPHASYFSKWALKKIAARHGLTVQHESVRGDKRDNKSTVIQHSKLLKEGKVQVDILVLQSERSHSQIRDEFMDDAVQTAGQGAKSGEVFGRDARRRAPAKKQERSRPAREDASPSAEPAPQKSADPVATVDPKQAPVKPGTGGAPKSDAPAKTTASTDKDPASDKNPEPAPPKVEPPAKLTNKAIRRFFNKAFDAQFKGQGLFHATFYTWTSIKKSSRNRFGSRPVFEDIASVWDSFAKALRELKTDVRRFSPKRVLKAQDKRGRDYYLLLGLSLARRKVTKAEDSKITNIEGALVKADKAHTYKGRSIKVAPETYEAFKKLYAAVPADLKEKEPQIFRILSGFRSRKTQEPIYKRRVARTKAEHPDWPDKKVHAHARKWVASPGGSAHNTGHAVDLYMGWSCSSSNAKKMTRKKGSFYRRHRAAWDWLKANAPNFGFLPYSNEPWHWEKWK